MSPAATASYDPRAASTAEAIVDAEAVAPQGTPCPACGAPVEPGDRFCPACGTPHTAPPPAAETPPAQRFFRCQNCSSEVATDPEQRSYTCPFCDSTYVVEFAPAETGRQKPEFVIGFAVTPDQAQEKFQRWLQDNGWFRPGDLRAASIADKLKGIYLPFWSFSMFAQSAWQATIGEHWYRTETYTETDAKGNTVTRTRQVQETEWWPLAGRHHQFHSGYLVSGSRGLKQSEADRIQPFQLPALKRYQPYFLAGWLCEEYSIGQDEALQVCQQEFHRREQTGIAAFLPGDTHRGLEVQTAFSQVSSDLCLLPIYLLSYRYRDRLYRFLVNGQTGKAAGDKPVSWKRIGIAALVAAALVLLIFFLLAALAR